MTCLYYKEIKTRKRTDLPTSSYCSSAQIIGDLLFAFSPSPSIGRPNIAPGYWDGSLLLEDWALRLLTQVFGQNGRRRRYPRRNQGPRKAQFKELGKSGVEENQEYEAPGDDEDVTKDAEDLKSKIFIGQGFETGR